MMNLKALIIPRRRTFETVRRFIIFVAIAALAAVAASCGGTKQADNKAANTKSNSTDSTNKAATSGSKDYYTSVYALKGPRMPDDAKLAEQKREFVNALHVKLKKTDGITSMNWDEKFKEPVNLKLVEDESVVVVTLASPAGGKLDKGVYEATDAADAADTAAKDKNLAIITLINSSGAKRLKGKVKVTDAGKIIMYSFDEKPDAPNLDSMSFGAPYKN